MSQNSLKVLGARHVWAFLGAFVALSLAVYFTSQPPNHHDGVYKTHWMLEASASLKNPELLRQAKSLHSKTLNELPVERQKAWTDYWKASEEMVNLLITNQFPADKMERLGNQRESAFQQVNQPVVVWLPTTLTLLLTIAWAFFLLRLSNADKVPVIVEEKVEAPSIDVQPIQKLLDHLKSSLDKLCDRWLDHNRQQLNIANELSEMSTSRDDTTIRELFGELTKNSNHCQQEITANANNAKGLAAEMDNAGQEATELSQKANNIGSILNVIKSIAEQTNLLALNAAIEAARAGEQGRGFAVVADEVRSLASKTQASTTEIQHVIEELQAASERVQNTLSKGKENAHVNASHAAGINDMLGAISTNINALKAQIEDNDDSDLYAAIKKLHQISNTLQPSSAHPEAITELKHLVSQLAPQNL